MEILNKFIRLFFNKNDNNTIIIENFLKKRVELISIEINPYPNRTIRFEPINGENFKEIHINKTNGEIISRESRKNNFPKIKYYFKQYDLTVLIQHAFLDEQNLLPIFINDIDAECIISQLLIRKNESSGIATHISLVNKSPYDYYSIARDIVKSHLDDLESQKEVNLFLKNRYQKFSQEDKIQYLYNRVLAEERMQGGYPIEYKKIVVTYISKWYKDLYQKYDSEYIDTLIKLLNKFNIRPNIRCIYELINLEVSSTDWKEIARENKLIRKTKA